MEKKVKIRTKTGTLRGTMYIPEGKGPFPGVIFFHGLGSARIRYLPMAQKLAESGMITLAFDFGGCGESDGASPFDQTPRMVIDDGRKILDFLLSQDIDKKRIGIQGTSVGAYVAGMLLKDYDFVKSLVLRAPAALSDKDLDRNIGSRIRGYYTKRENWVDSNAYNSFNSFKGHLLVIRSEKDELIPKECVSKFYELAANAKERKLYVLKNAGHQLSTNPLGLKEFHKIAVDWFLKTL